MTWMVAFSVTQAWVIDRSTVEAEIWCLSWIESVSVLFVVALQFLLLWNGSTGALVCLVDATPANARNAGGAENERLHWVKCPP
jgi:hypothetical protein